MESVSSARLRFAEHSGAIGTAAQTKHQSTQDTGGWAYTGTLYQDLLLRAVLWIAVNADQHLTRLATVRRFQSSHGIR